MALPARLCGALLLLLVTTAAHASLDTCASNPSACRVTGAAGPLDSDVAATAQGGPIGAAQTPFTVSGTLTFTASGATESTNMFDFSSAGGSGDATFGQSAPSGDYGNEDSPDGVDIVDTGTEFGSIFRTLSGVPHLPPTRSGPVGERSKAGGVVIPTPAVDGVAAPASDDALKRAPVSVFLQVLVDLTTTGQITITTQRFDPTTPPRSDLQGTLVLESPLFIGASDGQVPQRQPNTRLEDVLADSFKLKGMKEEREETHTAATPSDDKTQGQATTKAVQPAQTGISGGVTDNVKGEVTFLLGPGAFTSPAQVAIFDITLADPNPCAAGGAGGICCANGNLKNGGVCRSAPKGSCQLDSVCDGVNAACPASPNKLQGSPCLWSPSRSYLMGETVEGQDTKAMAVSAHDAAAWHTGKPAYDTEWPECKGVCIQGACALRWNHPACCYVHSRDSDSYGEDRGRPYESKGEEDISVSSFGYWRSRNWYCWK